MADLRISEAAALLGIGESTLRLLLSAYEIPTKYSHRGGRRVRLISSDMVEKIRQTMFNRIQQPEEVDERSTFGELLRYHMGRGTRPVGPDRVWSKLEVADHLQVSPRTVQAWIVSNRKPSRSFLPSIEKTFFGDNTDENYQKYREQFRKLYRIRDPVIDDTPSFDSLPKQVPTAEVFGPADDGRMKIISTVENRGFNYTEDQRDLYDEIRRKSISLSQAGDNLLSSVKGPLADFMGVCTDNFSDAIAVRVWSRGNSLRRKLSAHNSAMKLREPHPDRLDEGVAELLADLVETFNAFSFNEPKLREKDNQRLGPVELEDLDRELNLANEILEPAINNAAIVSEETQAELVEQLEVGKLASTDVHTVQAKIQAAETERNFAASLIGSAYVWTRRARSIINGEGDFVSKEISSGFWKAAGGALAVAAGGVLTGGFVWAYSSQAEIVQFVVSNADQLKIYFSALYPHIESVRLIDWIRNNAPKEGEKKRD